MNDELTKELLSILRAMKDGAPQAWQSLVEQRSTYCLTMGWACLVIALGGIAAGWAGVRLFQRGLREENENRQVAGALCFVIFLISFTISFIEGAKCFAEGLAPLGRVLEAIR